MCVESRPRLYAQRRVRKAASRYGTVGVFVRVTTGTAAAAAARCACAWERAAKRVRARAQKHGGKLGGAPRAKVPVETAEDGDTTARGTPSPCGEGAKV
jgi:hypothetical protein